MFRFAPSIALLGVAALGVSVAHGAPGGCTFTFNPPVTYGVGTEPWFVVTGDLDGDEDLDLVVANATSNNISVLLNNGDGSFANDVLYSANTPAALALGDLDGDDDLDVVIANGTTGVTVRLNNGNGTLAGGVTYGTGNLPQGVAIGDLNGDDDLDIAVANLSGATVSVLLNNGNGTFATHVTYGTGSAPWAVATGYLNGDGSLDLAVANASSDNVSVLLNNGNGTFADDVVYVAGNQPQSLAIGDLNGDGNGDLAVANRLANNVRVRFNAGNGTFPTSATYSVGTLPESVAVGDLDGDGDRDLVVASSASDDVWIRLNAGNGTFATSITYAAGDGAFSVAVGDLDGDGDLDLAVTSFLANNVAILLNECAGTLGLDCNGNLVCDLCDLANGTSLDCDGDGAPDECLSLYWSGGSGEWDDPSSWAGGIVPDATRAPRFDSTVEPTDPSYSVNFESDVTVLGLAAATDQVTLNLLGKDLTLDGAGPGCFGALEVGVYPGAMSDTRLFIDNTSVLTSHLLADRAEADGHPTDGAGRLTFQSDRLTAEILGDLSVGRTGVAQARIDSGTEADVLGDVSLGLEASGSGTLLLADATTSLEIGGTGSDVVVGGAGTGLVEVTTGARIDPLAQGAALFVGRDPGGQGTIDVDGEDSAFVFGGVVNLGNVGAGGGTAVLNVTAGGRFETTGVVNVGSGATVEVSGEDAMGTPSRIVASSMTTRDGSAITVTAPGRLELDTGLVILRGSGLSGLGTIDSNVFSVGTIAPGNPATDGPGGGTLTIVGDYQQIGPPPGQTVDDAGVLAITASGPNAGTDFGRLVVQGTAELGGGLIVDLVNGYQPQTDDTLTVLTATDLTIDDAFDVALFRGIPTASGKFLRAEYVQGLGPGGDEVQVVVGDLTDLFEGFADPESVNLDGLPAGVALADFDGDEGLDLAVALPAASMGSPGSVFVLFNNGSGFGASVQIPVGAEPADIAVGDFDGAMGLDLAVINTGDDTVSIVLNDGSPGDGFMPANAIAVPSAPLALAAGRFDGDPGGNLDLAIGNLDDGVTILGGDGAGGFTPMASIPIPGGGGVCGFDPEDIDNDRNDDLAYLSCLHNETGVIFSDPNGDGVGFTVVPLPVGAQPDDVLAVDLDRDPLALPEIVVTNRADGTVSVILNQGAGSFAPAVNLPVGTNPRSITATDIEQDGDMDLALVVDDAMGNPIVQVLRNDQPAPGDPLVFADAEEFDVGTSPVFILSGDIDADGEDDLVAVNEGLGAGPAPLLSPPAPEGPLTGSVNVLINAGGAPCPADLDGSGSVAFADLLQLLGQWGPCPGCAADLDGDGTVAFADLLQLLGAWGACR